MEELRKKIRKILESEYLTEDIENSQKNRLVSILNSLEFKNDIVSAGGEIYAVGGIVRDAVMGTQSDDLDIVVRGIQYEKLFNILSKYGKAVDTSHDKEDGEKDFGATKFTSSNESFNKFLLSNGVVTEIDVMLPRKDSKDPNTKGHKGIKSDVNPMYSIEDDLQRRDITINAIAMDLSGNIVSSGTGIEDIQNGIIKAVSEDSFIEDPLRILRSIRFSARYNFNIEPSTAKLIKDNAHLLADKDELNWERFLIEFKKMIGKPDLSRAVKLIVDLGVYKNMFGVESKINDYSKFQNAKNVGEMSYMMFDAEPSNEIINLVRKNITNNSRDISIVSALINYVDNIKNKNLEYSERIRLLSEIFLKGMDNITRTGPGADVLLNSYYIETQDRKIAKKFANKELPIGQNDVVLKGKEFVEFSKDLIIDANGEFFNSRDGIKLGVAKKLVLDAIYSGEIRNSVDDIKDFLENNKESWV